jgi:glycosyltransferase involved in cell wall biosynthesis
VVVRSDRLAVPPVPSAPLVSPVVGHNRWDLLVPPVIGHGVPELRISVVIPHYQDPIALERTLRSLEGQTYPSSRYEVIVVDDGSSPPLTLDVGTFDLDLQVAHQARQGFGAARARNLGASRSTGDVLVFLDCDMLAEPQHLEAHARWHHVCDHAVTIGMRRHVEVDDLDPATVGAAARAGGLPTLFADRAQQEPTYIRGHLTRTDDLRSAHDDLFRVVAAGNLGVGRDLFEQVGGFDGSFAQWGGEDTELGYRLFVAGGLLVPEPEARCWHQGAGHEPDDDELVSLDEQRVRLAHLVAHRGFRRAVTGRSYAVPRVEVDVRVGTRGRTEVLDTVESVLASRLHDLVVVLDLPDDHPDRTWLARQFGDDPRVVPSASHVPAATPVHVEVPAGAVLDDATVARLVDRLADVEDPIGVLEVTVPGRRPREARLRAWTTRALARATWAGEGDREQRLARAAELFGGAWASGVDLGVRWGHDAAGEDARPPDAAPPRPDGDAQAEAMALWQLLSRLEPSQRRRLIGAARAVFAQVPARQLARGLRLADRLLAVVAVLTTLRRVGLRRGSRRVIGRVALTVLPPPAAASLRARRARSRVAGTRSRAAVTATAGHDRGAGGTV